MAATGLAITPDRAARVAFTDPVAVVDELLIGRKGMRQPPRAPADLARRTVTIPSGTAFEASLAKLVVPGLRVEQVLGPVQQADLIAQVSRGERELAVVDSNVWEAEREWAKDAVVLFPIARKQPIGWAVHPDSKQLKAALDLFIQERALVAHADRTWTGDLAGVKKHRVLRVLTRNNAVSYFLLRGEAVGFDHDLMKRFADGLEVRLQIIVPPSHADLVPWLLEGKGDVIAASYTATPERGRQVAFSAPYLEVQELLVQRASEPILKSVAELRGRRIRVRPGSSYQGTLERLRAKGAGFTLELARADEETEQLIAGVAAGEVDLTVSDSHIFQAERVWRSDVVAAFALDDGAKKQIAVAVRPGDQHLKAALDRFVKQDLQGARVQHVVAALLRGLEGRHRVAGPGCGHAPGPLGMGRRLPEVRAALQLRLAACSRPRRTRRAASTPRRGAWRARWASCRSCHAPRASWASADRRSRSREHTPASSSSRS